EARGRCPAGEPAAARLRHGTTRNTRYVKPGADTARLSCKEKEQAMSNDNKKAGLPVPGRRALLGGAAIAGAAGLAAGGLGGAALVPSAQAQSRGARKGLDPHVEPGDLDEYYVFFSGG